MLALSLLVGAGAGLGAVAFRYMILGFTYKSARQEILARTHASNRAEAVARVFGTQP